MINLRLFFKTVLISSLLIQLTGCLYFNCLVVQPLANLSEPYYLSPPGLPDGVINQPYYHKVTIMLAEQPARLALFYITPEGLLPGLKIVYVNQRNNTRVELSQQGEIALPIDIDKQQPTEFQISGIPTKAGQVSLFVYGSSRPTNCRPKVIQQTISLTIKGP